jgi:hypothetical protein
LHRTIPLVRGSAVSLAITLFVAACTASVGGGGGAGAGSGTGTGATIGFANPTEGATVSIPFDVELTSSVTLDDPETGSHHAHIYFDTTTDAADYDIVYGNSWQVTRQLEPGEHTLTVALANPDHSLAGPTQELRIVVGDGGSGDGGATPTEAAPALPSY